MSGVISFSISYYKENVSDFISSNYDIIWQHPDSTPEDWNTFLLGEYHDSETMKKVNGAFISRCASFDSYVLIEGHSGGKPVDLPYRCMAQFYLRSPDRSFWFLPERLLGWDEPDHLEKVVLPYELYEKAQSELSHFLDVHLQGEKITCLNFKTILAKHVRSKYAAVFEKGAKSEHAALVAQRRVLDKVAVSVGKELNTSLRPVLAKKQKKWTLEDQAFIKSKVQELGATSWALLPNTMPTRTRAMVDTLEKVEGLRKNSSPFFLIAGRWHLQESADVCEEERQAFSLKVFYDYLKEHKNIVVLFPKVS